MGVFLGGGGDGGVLRELFRWRSLQKVTMVDIDITVTNFSVEWLPQIANGSFDDPRLNLVTDDALKYLRELKDGETFDVIILDFPDPYESQDLRVLYKASVYELCKSRMHESSLLVAQSGPCSGLTPAGTKAKCEFSEKIIARNFARVFPHVTTLMHPMATWKEETHMPSEWSTVTFGWVGTGDGEVKDVKSAKYDDMAPGLKSLEITSKADDWLAKEMPPGALSYYNGKRHQAAWAKPDKLTARLQAKVDNGRATPEGKLKTTTTTKPPKHEDYYEL